MPTFEFKHEAGEEIDLKHDGLSYGTVYLDAYTVSVHADDDGYHVEFIVFEKPEGRVSFDNKTLAPLPKAIFNHLADGMENSLDFGAKVQDALEDEEDEGDPQT